MTPAGKTITAMSTCDVTFADNEIARRESFHVIAGMIDDTDKFMADNHRHRDRFLRPGVPIIDMNIGTADGRFDDADTNVVTFDFRNGNFVEPQPWLGAAFHYCLHRLLHEKEIRRIMKAGKKEKLDEVRLQILCDKVHLCRDDAKACPQRLSKPSRTRLRRAPFSSYASSPRSRFGRLR